MADLFDTQPAQGNSYSLGQSSNPKSAPSSQRYVVPRLWYHDKACEHCGAPLRTWTSGTPGPWLDMNTLQGGAGLTAAIHKCP